MLTKVGSAGAATAARSSLTWLHEERPGRTALQVVIWSLPEPLPPSRHGSKYRLYYGLAGTDRVRYDNERGKGDHRHVNGQELAYLFESGEKLRDDFEPDVEKWSAA